jgi:hypothetical protein
LPHGDDDEHHKGKLKSWTLFSAVDCGPSIEKKTLKEKVIELIMVVRKVTPLEFVTGSR